MASQLAELNRISQLAELNLELTARDLYGGLAKVHAFGIPPGTAATGS